jgi:hypothetical protein
MPDIGSSVGSIAEVIGKSTAGEKLIVFGGLWGTLAFLGHWLQFESELIVPLLSFGSGIMVVGVGIAFYGRHKMEEKEIRLAEIAAKSLRPNLSRGDMAMLSIMHSHKKPMNERDIYSVPFDYDDSKTEAEIRGSHKVMRARFLALGGHAEESDGEYTPISGQDLTVIGRE